MKYILKDEYKNRTITFKPNPHTTGISVNLWNINDKMAELLINKGYGYLFILDEVTPQSTEESVVQEELHSIVEDVTTTTTSDCGCKSKSTTKRVRKPKK